MLESNPLSPPSTTLTPNVEGISPQAPMSLVNQSETTAQNAPSPATETGNGSASSPASGQAVGQDALSQVHATETTAQNAPSPATEAGNGEGNASPETGTVTAADTAKKRVSRKDKLSKMQALIAQGKSREEIMEEMGIQLTEFALLFFYHSQEQTSGIKVTYTDPIRKPKISADTGFAVSMHNISRLKANHVFVAGKKVDLKFDNEKNVIIASIYEGDDNEPSDEIDE